MTWIGWAQLCTLPSAAAQGCHRDECINAASRGRGQRIRVDSDVGSSPSLQARAQEMRKGGQERVVDQCPRLTAHGRPPTQEGVLRDDLENQVVWFVAQHTRSMGVRSCWGLGRHTTPGTPSRTHPGSDKRPCRKFLVL